MKFTIAFSGLLAALMAPVQSPAQDTPKPPTFSVVYTFTGGSDGLIVEEGEELALDRDGNIYGAGFGTMLNPDYCLALGCGIVFKIDRRGKETILHEFTGAPDGSNSLAGVTLDNWGNVYGMTETGGTGTPSFPYGYGTVFKIDPAGNESILHSFTSVPDGAAPQFFESLTLGKNGDLYGTTYGGGVSGACPDSSCGTVFKVTPDGGETVLYRFLGPQADGSAPIGPLAQDEDGNLYGATNSGGAYNGGTIFKLDPRGKETVLYNFTGGADGWAPYGVIRDCDGTLYGVTFGGGSGFTYSGYGVAFKLDSKGNFSVLHTFTNGADGGLPTGQLLRIGTDLYGATLTGGDLTDINCAGYGGCGVVYKLDSAGNETVLYTFTGFADGDNPSGGLVQDREGNLYGLTQFGGDLASPASLCEGYGCGVVYKLSPAHNDQDSKSEFAGGPGLREEK